MKWILKMAWRESRTIFKSLFLFILSISIGIAALVATNSLQVNLKTALDQKAKTLLGADLVIQSRRDLPPELFDYLDRENVVYSRETMFNSMAFFPKTDSSRLVVVRGLQGKFPYYGDMVTEPPSAAETFRIGDKALLEEALFFQFDLQVGDVVRIGQKEFEISGKLLKNAGEVMGSFFAAPRIFIGAQFVGQTNLIKTGSLRRSKVYIREESPERQATLVKELKILADKDHFRIESVNDRRETVGTGTDNLNRFLNLASFVVLLLGGIGVASSIQIYIQRKRQHMAILKCLGATGQTGLAIYSLQALILGLTSALVGAGLGVAFQAVLTKTLSTYLPISFAFKLSWFSIGKGIFIGCLTSFLFALLPLIPIKHVSPLNALRSSEGVEPLGKMRPGQRWLIAVIALIIFLFSYLHLKNIFFSFIFLVSLFGMWGLFWLTAKGLTIVLRKRISFALPYNLRQGLSNLYRPNNQTTLLLSCLGFGVSLIFMIFLTHQSLLKKFSVSAGDGRPNMGLFDIKTEQLPGVKKLIESKAMPVILSVPIVSMRLSSIKGISVSDLKNNENSKIPKWTLNREYRSTYRNQLNTNERIIAGEFHGNTVFDQEPYPVSIEEEIAKDLGVWVGDSLVFDVYGRPIETQVTSVRKVDWYQVQPTFFMVFSKGLLEKAPQFHVLTTNAPTSEKSAELQKAATRAFPEISVIDLRIVLDLVDQFVSQLSSVIRLVAYLIIMTGLIMLVGTLTTSRFQRTQETVLLRTLGANQSQVLIINLIEYTVLSVMAVLTGLIPSLVGSWALTELFFSSQFFINVGTLLAVSGSVILITVLIAILNFWPLLRQSPMEVLRSS